MLIYIYLKMRIPERMLTIPRGCKSLSTQERSKSQQTTTTIKRYGMPKEAEEKKETKEKEDKQRKESGGKKR